VQETLAPSPTSQPTAGEAPRWREVGSFGGAGSTEHVLGVTYGAGQFVAVGIHYDAAGLPDTGPVPHEGRVWLSPDGTSWEALPSMPTFEGATFSGLLTAQDGSVVAFGRVDVAGGPTFEFPGEPATWRSADGEAWERINVGLPDGFFVTEAARGAKGYLLVGSASAWEDPRQLWLSADGLSWELVYVAEAEGIIDDIGAGDDGFAALRRRPRAGVTTMASADGREWFDGNTLSGLRPLAPLAGDWIASATAEALGSIPVWFSTNGLAWSEVASISDPGYGEGFGGARELTSAGGTVFLSGARVTTASVAIPGGVWSSRDGRTWELTDIRPDGLVLAAAEHAGVVVLVGYVAGPEGRATFWLGQAS